MKEEKSCGAILYYLEEQTPIYLLIQHKNGGHWAFTKGHVEGSENEVETALREIEEEVGIKDVNIDTDFRSTTKYSPKDNVIKEVVYFVGQIDKNVVDTIKVQEEEVLGVEWLSFEEAFDKIEFTNDKRILKEAHTYLSQI